jgi:RHS repeat-associated protein
MSALARTTESDCYTRAANEDCVNGGPKTRTKYGYDSLDRLINASAGGTNLSWDYDANGNRLQQLGTAAVSALTPAGTSYAYNDRGRLVSAFAGGTSATYTYNALGQMIEKNVGGTATLLVYDEAGHLLGEYSSTGSIIQETIWLGDIPVATLRPNGSGVIVDYVHADQINSPRMVTRSSDNAILWRWDADPYGSALPNQNPQNLGAFVYNLRFPGQYYQAETGLMYNYMRDYDPATGRYLQSDPIGLTGGINTYTYAKSTPMMRADPSGLFALDTSFTWHDVPRIGGGWYFPVLGAIGDFHIGYTSPHLSSVSCTCKNNCGGTWSLVGCSASLNVDVYIRNDLNAGADQFSRTAEGEHVSDLMSGVGSIYRAGAAAEAAERGLPYSSQEVCESAASNAVNAAIQSAYQKIIANSRIRDANGSHTYPYPPFK